MTVTRHKDTFDQRQREMTKREEINFCAGYQTARNETEASRRHARSSLQIIRRGTLHDFAKKYRKIFSSRIEDIFHIKLSSLVRPITPFSMILLVTMWHVTAKCPSAPHRQ
jgi:hypothetical protein